MAERQERALVDQLIKLLEGGALVLPSGSSSPTTGEQRVMSLLTRSLQVLRDLEARIESGEFLDGLETARGSCWWDVVTHCRQAGAPTIATKVGNSVVVEGDEPGIVEIQRRKHEETLRFLRRLGARLSGWWDRKGQILDLYRQHGPMNVTEVGDKLAHLGDECDRTQITRLCRQLAVSGKLQPLHPVAAEKYRRHITQAGLADLANRGV